MANFLLSFIDILFTLLSIIIIVRVLLSWIKPDPSASWVQFILSISEPILKPFRQPIFRLGMLDLSPIIALIVLSIIQELLNRLIVGVF